MTHIREIAETHTHKKDKTQFCWLSMWVINLKISTCSVEWHYPILRTRSTLVMRLILCSTSLKTCLNALGVIFSVFFFNIKVYLEWIFCSSDLTKFEWWQGKQFVRWYDVLVVHRRVKLAITRPLLWNHMICNVIIEWEKNQA